MCSAMTPRESGDTPPNYLLLRRMVPIISLVAGGLAIVGIRTNPVVGSAILLLCLVAAALSLLGWPRRSLLGIARFYPKRSMLSPSWWESLYDARKRPAEVFLMGHSMSKTFANEKQAKAFVEWCSHGTKVRILFLSPTNTELAQLHDVGKGMKTRIVEDPIYNLRTKILNTIHELEERVISQVKDLEQKPYVRYATRDLPYSIMAVDDKMVVTLYGTEPEADEQPTFVIKGRHTHAYRSFQEEFERIWSCHSKVFPHEDPLIRQQKSQWTDYIDLRNYDSQLPPPRQAIIFPTYRCNEKCPDCMFKDALKNGESDEMDVQTFQNIVEGLARSGIKQLELSGGGEPLEHRQADDLLKCLDDLRKRTTIRLGLLTNGLHLDGFDPERILRIFNDYVRLSRYHRLSSPGREKELATWKNNIARLQECKRSSASIRTVIGIKYLLSPSNKDQLVQIVQDDMQDNILRNVDHIRFRADRRVDNGTITRVEQQVYYVMRSAGIGDFENTVSISLSHVSYPRNFRCWISPMQLVISPNGQVFVCCNYLGDERQKCIGSLKTQRFEDIWQQDGHRELRMKLGRDNCTRSNYSDCRWAELQNVFERIAFTAGVDERLP